jgi:NRPS condensation-like uncharacterized protein
MSNPFPLPLVPFEEYMLAENTAQYPRVFVSDAEFTGEIDRAALEQAWQATIVRHPMLNARLSKGRHGWQWNASDVPLYPINWAGEDQPMEFPGSDLMDLTREGGVRMWVRTAPAKARIVVQYHHACCDGMAGVQLFGDLMAEYARLTTPENAPKLLALDPVLLASRGTFGLTRPTFREWLGHASTTISESLRLVFRRAIPVAAPVGNDRSHGTPLPHPGLQIFWFDQAETEQLRKTAADVGATANELMMGHLFRTVVEWNRVRPNDSQRGWIRINVPTNLRRREDLAMPAANVMSFTFLDRRPSDCRDLRKLLDSIREEMLMIKNRRFGLYFIGQLALLSKIPGGMRMMVGGQRCFATAVLTNLGDLSRAFSSTFAGPRDKLVVGNLVLEALSGMPPLRPKTRVGIAIGAYAGRYMIGLQCDRHCFSREDQQAFMDTYVSQIRQSLAGACPVEAKSS